MKVSAHFDLREFIDPETWAEYGVNSDKLIDGKLINIAEYVRIKIDKGVTINSWHMGGQFKESGLRNKKSTTGAKLSQHKLGKAIDLKAVGYTGAEWYEFVKKNVRELYALGVRRIEDKSLATTWLHIDLKEHGKKCIQVVDLKKVVEEIKV